MEFAFTEKQERLRQEVRQFLIKELGPERTLADQWHVHDRAFSQKVAAKGWIGMTWPREYGGLGMSHVDRLVVTEELLRHGAPAGYHWAGDRQVGPALIKSGSDEQKRKFLPKIINAEISFCLFLSEPEAGSDLANVRTKATESGEVFLVNGAKIWTSDAHLADYGWLLAVTDDKARKPYDGMSEFIVDMKLPGITIRPLEDATGEHHLNQPFFDNVPLPKGALVGEKNRGWYQLMAQVDYERSGIERIMGNWRLFEGIVRHIKDAQGQGKAARTLPLIRDKVADLRVEFEVGRLLVYRVAWLLTQGKLPGYESAMAKAFGTTFEQRLANTAMEVMGMSGLLKPASKWAPMLGQPAQSYLRSPSYTIMGGTSEILRGIIALRGLGMPVR